MILGLCLKRDLIPDSLQNPVAVMFVVAVFTGAHLLQSKSGLLAVTIMGFAMANQKVVPIHHIVEFKENLRVLLITGVFILLAAHLQPSGLDQIGIASFAFFLVLVFIARPAAVFASTLGSKPSFREKLFISWMAPRGIVALPWSRYSHCAWRRWGWRMPMCRFRRPSLSSSEPWPCMA